MPSLPEWVYTPTPAPEEGTVVLNADGSKRIFEFDQWFDYDAEGNIVPSTRSYLPWPDIEKKYPDPADTICIWCGHQCGTPEALEEHEDACAPE
jgi:hypothetical protein